MVPSLPLLASLGLFLLAPAQDSAPPPLEDPRILPLVERFFAAQEAEDVEAYLALWSAKASKPRPEQLAFVFKAGDDRFSEIAIERVARVGDLLRVTVSVRRERTSSTVRPDGSRGVSGSVRRWSLALVEEGGELRIISEGIPADTLAVALLAAATPEERTALMDAEPGILNTRLLQALSARADSQAQIGQHAAARAIYERVVEVARRIGNAKAEGEALQNIGNTYYFQNRFAEALDAYEQRLALERDVPNDEGAAGALLGIATIKYSSFEYGDALRAYREALVLYEALDDEAGLATALLSTGNVLYLQGDLEGAIADYRRSRDLYKATHNTDGEARALAGLGRVYAAQGNYAAALEAFAGVQEEGRARGNRIMQANASQSTGEVHLRLGNAAAARAAFDDSRQHLEAAEDPAGVGRAWQGIALAELIAARFPPAEEAYGRSMTACSAAGDPECVARAIVGLAFALHLQDRHEEAIGSYHKAIEAFTTLKKPEEIGRAEVGLSQAHFGNGEFVAAAAAAVSARGRAPSLDVIWRARLAEARARRRMDQADGALASALAAVEAVEALRREALDQPIQHLSPDTASAYTFLAILHADAGDARAAFDILERGHAHALRLVLANHERDIVRHMSAEERDAERTAAARVGSLQAQIQKEPGLPKPDAKRIAGLEASLAGALEARNAQRARMFERWPELRVWRGLAPAVTVAEVADYVTKEETAVVQFAIDQDDLLVVTVLPPASEGDDVRFNAYASTTSRQALAELVAEAVTPAALRDVAEWLAAAEPLVEAIPGAAFASLGQARRAILVPDGVLWRVPFEALPLENGVVEDAVELTYAASMTALLRAAAARDPSPAAEAPTVPLAAGAAPDLPDARLATVQLIAPDWQVREPAAAEQEATAAATAFDDPPARVLVGRPATEGAFREAAAGAQLLHIGAPFRVNSASPLFSPLLWSEPGPEPGREGEEPPSRDYDPADDGVLEPREVMNLDLRAELVALTDGTAIAMRDAAGSIGTIGWAWRAAGVPAVLLRRWAGDDSGRDELLADVYARVREGEPAPAALRAARAARRAEAVTAAPWAWAGWIVVR